MSDHQPSDDLIARVLAGEASREESDAVAAWAADLPERRALHDRLRQVWQHRADASNWDVDAAWSRVSARLGRVDRTVEVIPIDRAPSRLTSLWRMAAAILVVIGVVFAWRALGGTATRYVTGNGEVLEVTLGDGTRIALAPRSRLRVPADFPDNRTLTLEGEAWFAVGARAAAPFEVRSGDYAVRDVGTEFTLRSRHRDSLQVVVVDGAVVVDRDGRSVGDTLRAGDVVALDGGIASRVEGDVHSLSSWRRGALEFTAQAAVAVVDRLSEWHGTRIVIADSTLATRPLTVTLPGDSLDEALDVLVLLLGVSVEHRDGQIVLR